MAPLPNCSISAANGQASAKSNASEYPSLASSRNRKSVNAATMDGPAPIPNRIITNR
ncbi:hypothetical protein D3C75_1348880 [compost metagenome]